MIRVPGHPADVESEQVARTHLGGKPAHVRGKLRHVDIAEPAVGIVEQLGAADAEDLCRRGELRRPDVGEVTIVAVQCGRLAMGEAQHHHLGTRADPPVEQSTHPERLVIGMGDHRENPGDVGYRVHRLIVPGQVRTFTVAIIPASSWSRM